jgi:hypothetical protein
MPPPTGTPITEFYGSASRRFGLDEWTGLIQWTGRSQAERRANLEELYLYPRGRFAALCVWLAFLLTRGALRHGTRAYRQGVQANPLGAVSG